MTTLFVLLATALTALSSSGWQIQHESVSFDKQTIYFSAAAPNAQQHDIYYCTRAGGTWSEPTLLPAEINDPQWDDCWPSISSDEQELYFVRRWLDESAKKPVWRQDIYLSHREQVGWSKAQPLIISDGGSVSPLILEDGKSLLFSSCRQQKNAKHPHYGVYFSRKTGKNDWLLPLPVGISDDSEVNYLNPRVVSAADGQYLVQVSQQIISRKDTTYRQASLPLPSEMQPLPVMSLSGSVHDAKSGRRLQAEILVNDAVTQTPIARYRTSSIGDFTIALAHGRRYSIDITLPGYSHSYLDYDCSSLTTDTLVRESISLTPELKVTLYVFDAETNSSLGEERKVLAINQLYDIAINRRGYEPYSLQLDTRKQVLLPSSELDILLTPGKAPLAVRLFDRETGSELTGDIALSNQNRRQQLSYQGSPLPLRQGDAYRMSVNAVGYLFFDTLISVPLSATPLAMDIPLTPIRRSMVMQLRNIQFETASFDLNEDSFEELDRVVRLLRENPAVKIELSAHTDDVGTDVFNMRLSERRGEAAMRYIIRQGIDADRITSRGYGKSRPLVANDSEENRAINRRVEFKVTEL